LTLRDQGQLIFKISIENILKCFIIAQMNSPNKTISLFKTSVQFVDQF